MEPDFYIVLGASGQIGSGLVELLEKEGRAWASVPWREHAQAVSKVPAGKQRPAFAFALGLTEASRPLEELREANVELPRRVIERAESVFAGRARYLTIGTIHERFEGLCRENAYFRSKHELGEWMSTRGERFTHARLHTVYGGEPKPHMFLGQMARALREKRPFEMSSGEQLREYHHVEDLVPGLLTLLRGAVVKASPVIEISSGEPVRLADLARGVFEAFGRADLLKLGALGSHPTENRETRFERVSREIVPNFRPTVPGVVETLRRYL